MPTTCLHLFIFGLLVVVFVQYIFTYVHAVADNVLGRILVE